MEGSLKEIQQLSVFFNIRLSPGIHQFEMAQEDIEKTVFNIENLHYEFLRMSFALKISPTTFQRVMDKNASKMNFEQYNLKK